MIFVNDIETYIRIGPLIWAGHVILLEEKYQARRKLIVTMGGRQHRAKPDWDGGMEWLIMLNHWEKGTGGMQEETETFGGRF